MSLLTPGPNMDELLDRLHAMGCDPPRFGRKNGEHMVWLNAKLPSGRVERHGTSLEVAARNMLVMDLTAKDKDRDKARDGFEAA